jgi:hypothetical protein
MSPPRPTRSRGSRPPTLHRSSSNCKDKNHASQRGWSNWRGSRNTTLTLREISTNNATFPGAAWTLSAPTALAIIALRVIRRIGDNPNSTGIAILNSESVLQYTGHAIDLFAENTTTGAICVGVRPTTQLQGSRLLPP